MLGSFAENPKNQESLTNALSLWHILLLNSLPHQVQFSPMLRLGTSPLFDAAR